MTANAPTSIFPFNGSAWHLQQVTAIVSSTDGQQVQLSVDYGTSSTFASKVGGTTATWSATSALVNSGSSVTLSLSGKTFTDGTIIYFRVKTIDASGNVSPYGVDVYGSSTYNYTIKASGGNFAPDGTLFMQQGNTVEHKKFIDVSSIQGTVTWSSVKSSGIDYAYLRCYGSDHSGSGDSLFETNVTNAKSAGVLLVVISIVCLKFLWIYKTLEAKLICL
jgi:hypothetical protein